MRVRAVIGGAGTYGEVYLHYLRASGLEVAGFLDDDPSKTGLVFSGAPVLGGMDLIPSLATQGVTAFYAPIGANRVRVRLHDAARRSGLTTPNFVHPAALVDSPLPPDVGIYVLPGSVIMPHSILEPDVMVSASANVAHHTRLGQGVFLSTGASVGAGIDVGCCAYIGMGAILVSGKVKRVGEDAVIGAASGVLADVGAGMVVAGTPARPLPARDHGSC